MELTKFIFLIIGAVVSIPISILGIIYVIRRFNTDKRKAFDDCLLALRSHVDNEDKRLDDKLDKSIDIVAEIKQVLVKLQLQSDLWWDHVRNSVLDTLKTAPTEPGYDALIEDLKRNQITPSDAKLLRESILFRMTKPENKVVLWAYSQAMNLLDIKIHEKRQDTMKNGLKET